MSLKCIDCVLDKVSLRAVGGCSGVDFTLYVRAGKWRKVGGRGASWLAFLPCPRLLLADPAQHLSSSRAGGR